MDLSGGSSGSNQQSSNPFLGGASKQLHFLENQFNPAVKDLLGQILNAFQTGGASGSGIPIIQNAVSQSRAATSQAFQGFESNLARMGAGSDPAAQGIASAVKMQGSNMTAQLPTQYIQSLMNLFPQLFGIGQGAITSLLNQNSSSGSSSGFNFGFGLPTPAQH